MLEGPAETHKGPYILGLDEVDSLEAKTKLIPKANPEKNF